MYIVYTSISEGEHSRILYIHTYLATDTLRINTTEPVQQCMYIEISNITTYIYWLYCTKILQEQTSYRM